MYFHHLSLSKIKSLITISTFIVKLLLIKGNGSEIFTLDIVYILFPSGIKIELTQFLLNVIFLIILKVEDIILLHRYDVMIRIIIHIPMYVFIYLVANFIINVKCKKKFYLNLLRRRTYSSAHKRSIISTEHNIVMFMV